MKIRHPFWFTLYNLLIIPVLYTGLQAARLFSAKIRRGIEGRKGLFRAITEIKTTRAKDRDIIMVHCASAGEFEAARPILSELHQRFPSLHIHITCYSPSGIKPISNAQEVDSYSYLPFDDPFSAKRFFRILKPKAFIFIKHDIWPNMVWAASGMGIPAFWINANLHQETRRLQFISRGLNRSFLGELTGILTVGDSHAERLANLVSPSKIEVIGDSRYDRTLERMSEAKQNIDDNLNSSHFEGKTVLIGGSTWGPDQRILIPAFAELKKNHPDLFLILVPHEPKEDFLSETDYYLRLYGLSPIRYSQLNGHFPPADVLLVDKVGILANLYRFAWVAFVGGAFGEGVHSILEPAVYGLPIFFGPKYFMAHEAQSLLLKGGAKSITNPQQLVDILETYLSDEKVWKEAANQSTNLVESGSNATVNIVDYLERFIKP